ncbi:hypothetical protein LbFV_ORF89 [Leptopilina boulardi filamentous virus]|uniref:Uncharacterized protein n=1 Tax=Leptopilina boulardi filamentous virus TaxID=552509 RepID=B9W4V9_9VIRU|nr:hypothetical protein LbFV_ORF89 [Leptopilina boulardi filamentous virus]AQQ80009.1 hypothetical protein LbFV_ORF89 [Leptopilina boulardi filamentous virus]CAT00560.1 hypothetical protein [Leptopilina boulardi filamentous virus]
MFKYFYFLCFLYCINSQSIDSYNNNSGDNYNNDNGKKISKLIYQISVRSENNNNENEEIAFAEHSISKRSVENDDDDDDAAEITTEINTTEYDVDDKTTTEINTTEMPTQFKIPHFIFKRSIINSEANDDDFKDSKTEINSTEKPTQFKIPHILFKRSIDSEDYANNKAAAEPMVISLETNEDFMRLYNDISRYLKQFSTKPKEE